jgi:hypothetical protein
MMTFDSAEWRNVRNQKLMGWVQDPFAVDFFLMVGDASEFFDDVVDADKPLEHGHPERVLFALLTQLPLNPFFDKYRAQLCAVMHTGINAWLDATELEKSADKTPRHRAYVLRDWNLELLMYIVYLTRGRDYMRSVSIEIRNFFLHETLDEYMEKLK